MTNSLMTKVAAVLCFVLAIVAARPARAQTFKVIHTFHSGKGPQAPSGELVLDAAGNLYGIAAGGANKCWYEQLCGTAFKMSETGKLLWVHSFQFPNGWVGYPNGGLLRDSAGNLYGTTSQGGKQTQPCGGTQNGGCGVAFKIDPTGRKETVLHRFTGKSDGYAPVGPPLLDSSSNLYGATFYGALNWGVVYKMNQPGKETVLYTFQGGSDGTFPNEALIQDSTGNLYGTTFQGGDAACGYQGSAGCGTIYEVNPNGVETVLYAFTWESDGAFPSSPLISDATGNLYGTTGLGGNLSIYDCGDYEGCGVVYKLSPNSNGTWTETTLYAFNYTDGFLPWQRLVRDAAGNFYGVTADGGSSDYGVVFKLDPAGNETVLHAFTGGTDGTYPYGALVMDASGNLYGTTAFGGDASCHTNGTPGCGVVFKITP
jgi:uncharacterized repeat protein (TIGR03803 family)